MDRQHRGLRLIRGNAIELTVDIEKQLEYLISNILFGGIKNRNIEENQHEARGEVRFFEDFILNTNHLTFGSKLKIFRSLYDTCSFFNDVKEECKTLATNIRKVIEWRDRFAHGEIAFKTTESGVTKEPYLFYYHDNKQKEQILNNKFFDEEINPLFSETHKSITNIRTKVNEKFKDDKPNFLF